MGDRFRAAPITTLGRESKFVRSGSQRSARFWGERQVSGTLPTDPEGALKVGNGRSLASEHSPGTAPLLCYLPFSRRLDEGPLRVESVSSVVQQAVTQRRRPRLLPRTRSNGGNAAYSQRARHIRPRTAAAPTTRPPPGEPIRTACGDCRRSQTSATVFWRKAFDDRLSLLSEDFSNRGPSGVLGLREWPAN
ncbi:MAG: hypothetical protein AW11_03290 [Candidatus Accumulibacter regalis]|uniref:Uncharacterized protein n=1 Tax=Accumulibacter regalis TaxID=522306 RepID=A0A011NT82_ACCRE|nr:MAG: hypothetical protein AW11_03290 [Candidatus Accumulibacter regalis]